MAGKEAFHAEKDNLLQADLKASSYLTGALLGSVLLHGLCEDLVWIHAERLIHKMLPLNETHRKEIAQVRGQIWDLYTELKAYKTTPDSTLRESISKQFDDIFTQKTSYATLNSAFQRIHKNKAELLVVLERPEIPLHTNGSETDIRNCVKKRKVSGGTRSDEGRRCRDTFASLKKTCRKLNISFWHYLSDRLGAQQ
jgi:hypothetical protein